MRPIRQFTGEYRFLSNFFQTPIVFEGGLYPTVENAYQAAKAPIAYRGDFARATPGDAKRRGRQVPIARDWEERKVLIMSQLLAQKFKAGTPLAQRLLATGDAHLEEGNNWGDTFWGTVDGRGANTLGHLLMAQRKYLREH